MLLPPTYGRNTVPCLLVSFPTLWHSVLATAYGRYDQRLTRHYCIGAAHLFSTTCATCTFYHSCDLTTPVICGDAARHHDGYQVGLFGPTIGTRLIWCPPEISNQQEAELFALDCATRLAVRLGSYGVTYVGDNSGTLALASTLRPFLQTPVQVNLVRRIRNRLLWSHTLLSLVWVPTALQPSDPASRTVLSGLRTADLATLSFSRWRLLPRSLNSFRSFGTATLP